FHVAEVFTGSPGVFVQLADTIRGFKGLCEGKYDHLPEAAFYMVGTIDQAVEKGKGLAAEAGEGTKIGRAGRGRWVPLISISSRLRNSCSPAKSIRSTYRGARAI